MTKTTLINHISTQTGLKKSDVSRVLNQALEVIAETIKKGETVTLSGFGSFSAVEHKPRNIHDISTGKTKKLPAKKVVKFKAGKGLRGKGKLKKERLWQS